MRSREIKFRTKRVPRVTPKVTPGITAGPAARGITVKPKETPVQPIREEEEIEFRD